MPIYEYKCHNCDLNLEKIQKFSDDTLVKCPECNKDTLTKLIGKTSFRIGGLGVHKPTAHWGDLDHSQ